MKKLILSAVFLTSMFAGFINNKEYNCTTIGLSFKDKNQTINIPNNEKTKEELKKVLKHLYSVNIKFKKNSLEIKSGKTQDTLAYVKKYRGLDVYTTKDHQAFMFVDVNHTQVGLNIPSQNTMIFYQCK